ncbi:hypothetical protein ACH3XW_21600 [Acanthocheilonema viteae]|uniref:Uncharacterized protein n=1 Tax=Acanthocheilonema viteae TaxID=6277 RepID=A0A498S925_ACAVI|nr:unnamed protein product [Acanthocheilonema viteae]
MSQSSAQIRKQLVNLERDERALQRLHVNFTGLARAVQLESIRLDALKSKIQSSQRTLSPNISSGPDCSSVKMSDS